MRIYTLFRDEKHESEPDKMRGFVGHIVVEENGLLRGIVAKECEEVIDEHYVIGNVDESGINFSKISGEKPLESERVNAKSIENVSVFTGEWALELEPDIEKGKIIVNTGDPEISKEEVQEKVEKWEDTYGRILINKLIIKGYEEDAREGAIEDLQV